MIPQSPVPADADDFHDRTLQRLQRTMIIFCVAGVATAWPYFGWRTGLGFAVGGAIACLNFYWLQKVVAALAEQTVHSGTPASSGGIVHRFLLRYFLMAVVGFAILTVSREAMYGFFSGLSIPVGAILCEAAYQTYRVVIRGR